MWPIEVVARGSVSGAGLGDASYALAPLGHAAPRAVRLDARLGDRSFGTPPVAQVALRAGADRVEQLLSLAAGALKRELETALPQYRALRIGLILGTSAGKMDRQEQLFRLLETEPGRAAEDAAGAPYAATLDGLSAQLGIAARERCLVLGACASSTFAVGLGARWLDAGYVDLVIAGGVDALSELVCAGFESLGIISANPSPFGAHRDGMALGEAACLLALRRASFPWVRGSFLLGFGCSSDAHHVTAPEPTGRGLVEAARAALDDAGLAPTQI
ncbi:MAG: hypothetical protein RJA70_3563, partial [Pseudomonadota bacterium]